MSHRLIAPLTWLLLLGCRGGNERARDARERDAAATRPAAVRPDRPGDDAEADPEDEAKLLAKIGYLEAEEVASTRQGVTIHDASRAQAGSNLVVSAHAREVYEMDMAGATLRTWRLPKAQVHAGDPTGFRRAFPTPDGGLLAILEGAALVRFGADGAFLWRADEHAHHDLVQLADGRIVALTRRARRVPSLNRSELVIEDRVTTFTSGGDVVGHVSVLQALLRSPWRDAVTKGERTSGDVLHTNSVKVLDGAAEAFAPAFRAGNLLVSMLYPSVVGVIDPDQGTFVWALADKEFHNQHDAELLPDRRLQIFDNLGGRPYSVVRVYDLATREQVWSYGGTEAQAFATKNCGSAELLPNGNRLVVESNHGRAFEIAPDGAIVWEWFSPHRGSKKDSLVANLFDLVRIPASP